MWIKWGKELLRRFEGRFEQYLLAKIKLRKALIKRFCGDQARVQQVEESTRKVIPIR